MNIITFILITYVLDLLQKYFIFKQVWIVGFDKANNIIGTTYPMIHFIYFADELINGLVAYGCPLQLGSANGFMANGDVTKVPIPKTSIIHIHFL